MNTLHYRKMSLADFDMVNAFSYQPSRAFIAENPFKCGICYQFYSNDVDRLEIHIKAHFAKQLGEDRVKKVAEATDYDREAVNELILTKHVHVVKSLFGPKPVQNTNQCGEGQDATESSADKLDDVIVPRENISGVVPQSAPRDATGDYAQSSARICKRTAIAVVSKDTSSCGGTQSSCDQGKTNVAEDTVVPFHQHMESEDSGAPEIQDTKDGTPKEGKRVTCEEEKIPETEDAKDGIHDEGKLIICEEAPTYEIEDSKDGVRDGLKHKDDDPHVASLDCGRPLGGIKKEEVVISDEEEEQEDSTWKPPGNRGERKRSYEERRKPAHRKSGSSQGTRRISRSLLDDSCLGKRLRSGRSSSPGEEERDSEDKLRFRRFLSRARGVRQLER